MSTYPAIRNILSSLFSSQTGLDDDAASAAYLRAIASDSVLKAEVDGVFSDGSVNWSELLFNDEYEVYEADSEEDAKEFAKEILEVN